MQVRVYECTSKSRRQAAEIGLTDLVRYIRREAGEDQVTKLRADLEGTGRARINGEFVWFEYERVD
ncbi:hypothetical protein [Aureimonas psammosilenae]|uniref:hypothetical protein n=1 Tax=Aureimonas psammosilenae TaxID=2495496 RepID=UPI001260BDED|nr:hypothetical protein [Aureimonas psammosilenae]